MVATAPSTPSSLAGPPAQGRSASRSASDRRGAIEVLPENAVFGRLAGRRPEHAVAASCIGRARPHHRDSHRGRRRFSGQTRGGRYSWARYYHPQLQRFISEDPFRVLVGRPNLFDYVENNPLKWRDPFGLFTIAVSGGYEVVPGAGGASYHSGGYWSIGESAGLFNTYGSNNTGVEASAGISFGVYRGGVNQFMGPFSNWNVQTPWASVSFFFDASGKFMGAGFGLGLGIGAANTQTNTVPAALAPRPSEVWQAPWNYNPPRSSTRK